jgi:hypothetical protein
MLPAAVPKGCHLGFGSSSARKRKSAACSVRSTRRAVQFLAAMYIHVLMLLILAIFSRNMFSAAIPSILFA